MRKEKQVIKRLSMLFIGIILGASGYSTVLTQSEYARPQLHPDIDIRKAVDVTIAPAGGNWVNSRYFVLNQVCCDCALYHNVVLYDIPDEGLRMLWWRDEPKTRKDRVRKGWDISNSFSAEKGMIPDEIR